ncbi:OmpA family protein [Saccharopolyspora sp. WRP15-2]|uniref:OmpA family protein n=1 Tax=Saccharopolyspora oryzae TaxID=2997343 RepID=A0ABT4V8P9_9PSEU|nr:OmpA family protein [Saccharopolyspora oryzae]MDA3630337.1 OmpA family protein [Saccharopolyspora oryzae]
MRRTNIKYAAVLVACTAALLSGCAGGQGGDGDQGGDASSSATAPPNGEGQNGQGQGQGEGQGQEGQGQGQEGQGQGQGEGQGQGQDGQGQGQGDGQGNGQENGQGGDAAAAKTKLQGDLESLTKETPITFNPDSPDLTDQGKQAVTKAAEMIKQAPPELRFEVTGHTAMASGSSQDGQELSKARAQAVADQLGQAGVSADRLQVVGNGDAEGDPNSARRVDLEVI